MPRFKLIPITNPEKWCGFETTNVASVIYMIVRKKFGKTDVYQDEEYVFSIDPNENGMLTISREHAAKRILSKYPGNTIVAVVHKCRLPGLLTAVPEPACG